MDLKDRIKKLGIAKKGEHDFQQDPGSREFYVVREYSWTDKRRCWKILTRNRFEERLAALDLDFYRELEPKIPKEDFFVVEVKKNLLQK
jgi:hypothetical protein